MRKKKTKYKYWVSGAIILFIFVCLVVGVLKTISMKQNKSKKDEMLYQAKQLYLDGAYKQASSLYEKILILEPDSAEASLDLAVIYDDYIGDKERAVELYEHYLKLAPDSEKKELVLLWIKDAKQASFGVKRGDREYESKLSKMQKEIDKLNKEKTELEKEVERLSGELYNIEAEHQKEKEAQQEQRRHLAEQAASTKAQVAGLTQSLKKAEEEKEEIQKELEKLKYQRRL